MVDLTKISADFPILNRMIFGKRLVYLDNAATTQKPQAVIDRILSYYSESNSNIHRGIHHLSEQAGQAYETARMHVKDFLNARSLQEVVFTRGTTEAINLVAQCFGSRFIKAGDEIIVTEMEHHSNFVPWQLLCHNTGAVLKVVPIRDNGELCTDMLPDFFSAKTKLLAITSVSNALGTVNPVKAVIAMAHDFGVPVLIDGAQAVQHMPTDVQDLDCDFFVFSGHKIYAETGIGVLYGKERWLEKMPPYQSGGGMIASVSLKNTSFAELPYKFEAGTPNIAGAISLDASMSYLEAIGFQAICAHERRLADYAVARLESIEGIQLYGNGQRCAVVSFNLPGISPYDLAMLLDKMGIAIRSGNHCAEPTMRRLGIGGTARASLALYNTREDIDALAEGIEKARNMLL